MKQNDNDPVMMAGKEEATCLLDVGGHFIVKAFFPVQVQRIKYDSPAPELVIKNIQGKRSCLLDAEKGTAHVKARGDSWGMETSEGSQHHPISF